MGGSNYDIEWAKKQQAKELDNLNIDKVESILQYGEEEQRKLGKQVEDLNDKFLNLRLEELINCLEQYIFVSDRVNSKKGISRIFKSNREKTLKDLKIQLKEYNSILIEMIGTINNTAQNIENSTNRLDLFIERSMEKKDENHKNNNMLLNKINSLRQSKQLGIQSIIEAEMLNNLLSELYQTISNIISITMPLSVKDIQKVNEIKSKLIKRKNKQEERDEL